ncbi:hypothetical protein UT300012_32980 [Paraclostridium bifermentans]
MNKVMSDKIDLNVGRLDGLTEKEGVIMDHVVAAWNKFTELENNHPSEWNDFADAVHKLQRILGLRILRRDYPEGWIKK